jgi:hypothetical protein
MIKHGMYRRRRAAAGMLAMLTLGTAAGCTSGTTGSPPPNPTPRSAEATPSAAPSVDVTTTQILATYRSYQDAYQAAAAVPNPDDAELRKYVGDPLLTQVLQDLRLLKTNGLVRRGTPKVSPTVAEAQLTATPPVATIQDCYDVSDVHVVNRTTGKSADAPSQATRYVVMSQAKFFGGPTGWLIVQSDADRSRAC